MRAKRLFVSLALSPAIAPVLVRLNPGLRGVRWIAGEQMHLTLAFLGHVAPQAEEKLRDHLRAIRFGAFFLPLRGISTFPARGRPRIIWLGVGTGHPHLFQLHKRVTDAALAAGLEPDLRPWHPHITLARCENVSAESIRPFLRAHAEDDFGLVQINFFSLQSSRPSPEGSIYASELEVHA